MAYSTIFAGTVKGSEVDIQDLDAWKKTVHALEGKRVKLTIKEFKASDNIRSIRANSYYWAIVVEDLREFFGYNTKEEFHDVLGMMFRRDYTGPMPTIQRTSAMSSKEFWSYIERVTIWAATEHNFTVPPPNRVTGVK